MNTNVVVIDQRSVELHDAFLSYVPQVFRSISFARWYELGGWSAGYRAFAIFESGRIVANVSVQRIELVVRGKLQAGWQLGAVGVLPEFRGRGLQRILMQRVLDELPNDDVVFLFANEDVLDFYPLFGFRRVTEFLFGADHTVEPAAGGLRRMSLDCIADRQCLSRIAASALPATEQFGAQHYGDVLLWYWTNFHGDDFFYDASDDAIVIAEHDMEVLRVLDVLAARPIDLRRYLPQIASRRVDYIEFGFTPERLWPSAIPLGEYLESPLFIRGDLDLPATPFKYPVLAQT